MILSDVPFSEADSLALRNSLQLLADKGRGAASLCRRRLTDDVADYEGNYVELLRDYVQYLNVACERFAQALDEKRATLGDIADMAERDQAWRISYRWVLPVKTPDLLNQEIVSRCMNALCDAGYSSPSFKEYDEDFVYSSFSSSSLAMPKSIEDFGYAQEDIKEVSGDPEVLDNLSEEVTANPDTNIKETYNRTINRYSSGNYIDFAHQQITTATYLEMGGGMMYASGGGRHASARKPLQHTFLHEAAGWRGDATTQQHTMKPSMGLDDYTADLDAVNIASRVRRNPDADYASIMTGYYKDVAEAGSASYASESFALPNTVREEEFLLNMGSGDAERGFSYVEEVITSDYEKQKAKETKSEELFPESPYSASRVTEPLPPVDSSRESMKEEGLESPYYQIAQNLDYMEKGARSDARFYDVVGE